MRGCWLLGIISSNKQIHLQVLPFCYAPFGLQAYTLFARYAGDRRQAWEQNKQNSSFQSRQKIQFSDPILVDECKVPSPYIYLLFHIVSRRGFYWLLDGWRLVFSKQDTHENRALTLFCCRFVQWHAKAIHPPTRLLPLQTISIKDVVDFPFCYAHFVPNNTNT